MIKKFQESYTKPKTKGGENMKKIIVLFFVVAMLMMSTSAMAIPILDFDMSAPTAGSISYAGGAAPLVGSAINVDTVIGLGTSLNNSVTFNLINAVLNFSTGNLIGGTATSLSFGAAPSSNITLSGTVDVDGNGVVDASDITGTLFSGSFGQADIFTAGTSFRVAIAGFFDEKHVDLLALYGLPISNYLGNFNLSFTAVDNNLLDGFRSTTLLSGDITNSPVPEPGTLLLLGTGLASLAFYARRRRN